jgi:hypothetical protein
MVRVDVTYPLNGQVENYPTIEGPYVTTSTFPDGRAHIVVWSKRYGNVLRSVTFREYVSIDREFAHDHYSS